MVGRLTGFEGHRTAGSLLRIHSQPLPHNVRDVIVSNTALLLRTRDVPCSNLAYSILFVFFFFSFLRWGENESTWYVGYYWPIVPATG
jgi:hypothetical protein